MVDVREFVLGVDRTAFIENQRMIALKPGSAAERVGARKGDRCGWVQLPGIQPS